jgi:hypothetical protein
MRIASDLCVLFLMAAFQLSSAQDGRFAKDRPGAWSIENQISKCENRVDVAAFTKGVTGVAEWLHKNDALVTQPKGDAGQSPGSRGATTGAMAPILS